ncbi:tripartite motif-containing 13-like isoform X2 [Pomacea canaliculata]|uniref:tripartite motif-containing 13-like isoform X2 n=1 Tax=Pomacea canaliculata TaxID=400727 RepID=UPI000D72BF79|nr:tripartite motif-containing 13-like isoform X2 [Pomacea canaliculata]
MAELLTVDCDCCPVCHELYSEPKLLPCAHTICRDCVLLWLRKTTWKGSCPLCRTPILSKTTQQLVQQSDHDLIKAVDELPTDQCHLKLCSSCSRYHRKVPSISDHDLHDLRTLTSETFAALSGTRCASHVDKMADLYCSDHRVVICMECATKFSHKRCNVDGIENFGKLERKRLKERVCCLQEKEKELEREIKHLEDITIKACSLSADLQKEVHEKFDKMAQTLNARRQELVDRLKASECDVTRHVTSAKSQLEMQRAVLAAHANVGERMVAMATDGGILTAVDKLEDRLKKLEKEEWKKLGNISMEVVSIDHTTFDRTQRAVAELGQLTALFLEATSSGQTLSLAGGCGVEEDDVVTPHLIELKAYTNGLPVATRTPSQQTLRVASPRRCLRYSGAALRGRRHNHIHHPDSELCSTLWFFGIHDDLRAQDCLLNEWDAP